MRNKIISGVAGAALAAGVGVALAQSPTPPAAPPGAGGASPQSGAPQTTGTVGGAGARVNVTSDQQSKLTNVVKKISIREATNINAAVAVGSTLPANVELVSVPSEIIEVVPMFSAYRAIRVGGRILIVEPDTRRVVYIFNV